jgi:glycosyltransferase involved in cell wall biosynthesis
MTQLRVGITSCRDRASLELCLESLGRTLGGVEHELVVVDCGSEDGSVELAERSGARVIVRSWSQSDALNWLLATSKAEHTLLLHSDVVLLAEDWYERTAAKLGGRVVLVSPEDVGVGPMLRAEYGRGMPESSFMLWHTEGAGRLRKVRPRLLGHQLRNRLPLRVLHLYHLHVTHYLPAAIAAAGLEWLPMDVLESPRESAWFAADGGVTWEPAWGELRYGFGNFYALDGCVTHFHQWYSRDSVGDGEVNADGVPLDFLRRAADRFRADYLAGAVRVPEP